ncbi:MAG: hypothetical protein EPO24_11545 [Bacteroidetes bacterium]|nr:MAG: hypothetical protein EPO24_11545 [Bacteroidota bacterium]
MNFLENLSREELITLINVYAKNWLAHDGCWFLAAEEQFGIDTAIELDKKSWHRFAVAEARRIMKEFNIPENGGLASLEKAFKYRLYSAINKQEIVWVNDHTMIFKMVECRVQKTRSDKSLPLFPCKSVGMVEFSQFAKTIDTRIQAQCVSCPPDPVGDTYCAWEFTVEKK